MPPASDRHTVESGVVLDHHAGGDHAGVRLAGSAGEDGDWPRFPVDQILADEVRDVRRLQSEQMTPATVEEGEGVA